jgi:hypothetical protein
MLDMRGKDRSNYAHVKPAYIRTNIGLTASSPNCDANPNPNPLRHTGAEAPLTLKVLSAIPARIDRLRPSNPVDAQTATVHLAHEPLAPGCCPVMTDRHGFAAAAALVRGPFYSVAVLLWSSALRDGCAGHAPCMCPIMSSK